MPVALYTYRKAWAEIPGGRGGGGGDVSPTIWKVGD